MEKSFAAVKRKVFVCAQARCRECGQLTDETPEDCPYLILHALDTSPSGFRQLGRRTGKTTLLVQQANYLAEMGYPVYYLTLTHNMAWHVSRNYGLDKRVVLLSSRENPATRLSGLPPGWLFVDEVPPEDLSHVESTIQRHKLVAGLYT